MNNKNIIQLFLLTILIISSVLFYLSFFKNTLTSNNAKNISEIKEANKSINKDIIEGVKYSSKDKKGNIYFLEAKNAVNSKNNENLVVLKSVKAKLIFDQNKQVDISSEFAEYNLITDDTFFYNDVKLVYDDHRVYCDNIDVKFTKNIAILNGNLIYKSLASKMLADQMVIDLLRRTSRISMTNKNKKIKINSKNGFN